MSGLTSGFSPRCQAKPAESGLEKKKRRKEEARAPGPKALGQTRLRRAKGRERPCNTVRLPSEVIREALRALQEQEELRRIRLADLRKDLAIGIAQADRNEVAPLDGKSIQAKARSARKAAR